MLSYIMKVRYHGREFFRTVDRRMTILLEKTSCPPFFDPFLIFESFCPLLQFENNSLSPHLITMPVKWDHWRHIKNMWRQWIRLDKHIIFPHVKWSRPLYWARHQRFPRHSTDFVHVKWGHLRQSALVARFLGLSSQVHIICLVCSIVTYH